MQPCLASLCALQLLIYTALAAQSANVRDHVQKQQGLWKTSQYREPTRNKLTNKERVVYQTSSFNADTGGREVLGNQGDFSDKHASISAEEKATTIGNQSELKNSTSKNSLQSNSREQATVVALAIVCTAFGLGLLAVLLACLFHKYRARLNGYQLLTKRNVKKRRKEKQAGKQKDYATLESISEERLFVENDDSCSDDDQEDYQLKQPRNSTNGNNKKSMNFKPNNNDSTTRHVSNDVNIQKDPDSVDCDKSNIESDDCSNKRINSSDIKGRFKRSRKWSLQRQCDKGQDNKLARSFALERNIVSLLNSTQDHNDVNQNMITDDTNTSTSEESITFQATDDLENSNHQFNYNDEPFKGLNRNKRQSIQATVYNVPSDSDDDYKLNESMEQLETESKTDVDQSNKQMSDPVIYFDYNLARNTSYAFATKLEGECSGINEESSKNDSADRIDCLVSEPTVKNKYIIAEDSSHTYDADNSTNRERNRASSSYLSLENEVKQESMRNIEFNESKHAFNEEISREEMKKDFRDIMLDISSSIYYEGFRNILHRCSSDSQLKNEKTMKISASCMNLKSFSTSNLRGVHLMPSPSSFSKAQFSDSPKTKKKSPLQKRLKVFKGFFKKRKKGKTKESPRS